jgi:hypothetical protein
LSRLPGAQQIPITRSHNGSLSVAARNLGETCRYPPSGPSGSTP